MKPPPLKCQNPPFIFWKQWVQNICFAQSLTFLSAARPARQELWIFSALCGEATAGKTCGLDEMGLRSTCVEQFPGPWSWIKRGISLDYSLWWPLRVLSSWYLKHSPQSTLRPAQRKLQGFEPFESFKVQALEHLSLALLRHGRPPSPLLAACLVTVMEAKMVFSTGGFLVVFFFSWWLTLILLYTHFLAWTVGWFNI